MTTAPLCLVDVDAALGLLRVQFLGDLDEATVTAAIDRVAAIDTASDLATVDLRQAMACTMPARTALVRLDRALVQRTRRRAWIASSARWRGIALWVLHVAEDEHGRTVVDDEGAHLWLAGQDGRRTPFLAAAGAVGPRPLEAPSLWLQLRTRAMAFSGWLFEGYEVPFIEELVRTYGLRRIAAWGSRMGRVREDVHRRWGHRDGQTLIAFAAFWEGCTVCSRGHLYAANLLRFREDGSLFPLHHTQLRALQARPDAEVLAWLEEHLAPTHPGLLATLQRLYALRAAHALPESADDHLLHDILEAWGIMADCSVTVDPDDVPALHAAVTRDTALQQRYAEAVARSRAPRAAAPVPAR